MTIGPLDVVADATLPSLTPSAAAAALGLPARVRAGALQRLATAPAARSSSVNSRPSTRLAPALVAASISLPTPSIGVRLDPHLVARHVAGDARRRLAGAIALLVHRIERVAGGRHLVLAAGLLLDRVGQRRCSCWRSPPPPRWPPARWSRRRRTTIARSGATFTSPSPLTEMRPRRRGVVGATPNRGRAEPGPAASSAVRMPAV